MLCIKFTQNFLILQSFKILYSRQDSNNIPSAVIRTPLRNQSNVTTLMLASTEPVRKLDFPTSAWHEIDMFVFGWMVNDRGRICTLGRGRTTNGVVTRVLVNLLPYFTTDRITPENKYKQKRY